jgi:formamidopyrimidine-DNA glycosylase
MPELPEVEVLVRHLRPLIQNKTIRDVEVRRARVIAPTSLRTFQKTLTGAKIIRLTRRAKYLVFELKVGKKNFVLLGHLGMTGRMFVVRGDGELPKHAAVVFGLGRGERFVYEDQRYFGRLTLEASALEALGPEPLGKEFTVDGFAKALKRSSRPIKVKLLDQELVSGIGNIYASEALYRAKISPRLAANRLKPEQVKLLWKAIREVLTDAVERGSTVPLSFHKETDGLFYFGGDETMNGFYEERLRVYDRKGKPCRRCGTEIERIVQAARSTFFCPQCQNSAKRLR